MTNPNRRLGYSKKGWTDCELTVLWLKHFDEYTKGKANGRACLLIVNGHNSHYSFEFLDFARNKQIHVLSLGARGHLPSRYIVSSW